MSRNTLPVATSRQYATHLRLVSWYVIGGSVLATLMLVGCGVLWPALSKRHLHTIGHHQMLSYQRVPALFAQARAHDPLLRLPHARWFIRVQHGHTQLIVVDHTAQGREQDTLTVSGEPR